MSGHQEDPIFDVQEKDGEFTFYINTQDGQLPLVTLELSAVDADTALEGFRFAFFRGGIHHARRFRKIYKELEDKLREEFSAMYRGAGL